MKYADNICIQTIRIIIIYEIHEKVKKCGTNCDIRADLFAIKSNRNMIITKNYYKSIR